MKIEAEDFKQWLDHPVTEEVMRRMREKSADCASRWFDASRQWLNVSIKNERFDTGLMIALLTELKTKEEVFSDLANLEYKDIKDESD